MALRWGRQTNGAVKVLFEAQDAKSRAQKSQSSWERVEDVFLGGFGGGFGEEG